MRVNVIGQATAALSISPTAPYDVANMIKAWHIKANTPEWLFVVCASALIRFTDEIYAPVRETLSRLDVSAVRVETLYDPLMMNHRAVVRCYTVAGFRPAGAAPAAGREPPGSMVEEVA